MKQVEELTQREWEVLALVREGLTNEQIASRLGISRDGVKYHVSEILGKLGVSDRIEAARWYDRQTRHRAGLFAWLGGLFQREEASLPGVQAVAAGAIVVACVVLVSLFAGVLLMQSRGPRSPEVLPPEQTAEAEPEVERDISTGDRRLDALVERLAIGDASVIESMAPGVLLTDVDTQTGDQRRVTPGEWTVNLAGSRERHIHSVLESEFASRDFEVQLRVVTQTNETQAWLFVIAGYAIVDVSVYDHPSNLEASLGRLNDYLVLPPPEYFPQAPGAHALSARSGVVFTDTILNALEAQDAAGLIALLEYQKRPCSSDLPFCDNLTEGSTVDALPVTDCGRMPRYEGRSFVERRLTAIAGGASGIHGAASLPAGHYPSGDEVIMVFVEDRPYRWQSNGFVMTEGRITGLINRCSDRPDQMYPPAAYVVAPPPDLADLDPARRSGIEVIDAYLDGLAARDLEALVALTRFEFVDCVTEQLGIGAPPLCEPGEPEGTPVAVITSLQCEGGYVRKGLYVERALPALAEPMWSLYAVLDLGPELPGEDYRHGRYQVILHSPDRPEFFQGVALLFNDEGLTLLRYGCGQGHPMALFWPGRAPQWILAPP